MITLIFNLSCSIWCAIKLKFLNFELNSVLLVQRFTDFFGFVSLKKRFTHFYLGLPSFRGLFPVPSINVVE